MLDYIAYKQKAESPKTINPIIRNRIILALVISSIALIPFLLSDNNELPTDLGTEEIEVTELQKLMALDTNEVEETTEEQLPNNWQQYQVTSGDSLGHIIVNKLELGYSTVLALLQADKKSLTNIKPGDQIDYHIDESGNLVSFKLRTSSDIFLFEQQTIDDINQGFSLSHIPIEVVYSDRYYYGQIDSTLGNAVEQLGLGISVTVQIANVLGERLDFRREVQKNDEFAFLLKQGFREGKLVSNQLTAVQFEGARQSLLAMRHKDDNFYDIKGNSLQRAFRRSPVKAGVKVSGRVGLRKKHPVTGRRAMHNGTDYLVYTGSPVYSTSDGVVITSKNDRLGGNMIVVKHNEKYLSKYLHLSNLLVKKGDKVKMGEKIGLSGATGRVTGAHLHYELHINGKPVDSLNITLPQANELSAKELATFKANTAPFQQQLAGMFKPVTVASIDNTP